MKFFLIETYGKSVAVNFDMVLWFGDTSAENEIRIVMPDGTGVTAIGSTDDLLDRLKIIEEQK